MRIDPANRIASLAEHIAASQMPAAEQLVKASIADIESGALAFDGKQRKAVLDTLRRARRFDDLGKLAQALMRSGHDNPNSPAFDPHPRRQYAQALIESGQLAAAVDSLLTGLSLIASAPGHLRGGCEFERREMLGLLGRAHKQIYMDEARNIRDVRAKPNPEPLRSAIMWYEFGQQGLDAIDGHWHLVNMIALVARAERDGVRIPIASTSGDMALKAIEVLFKEAESATPRNNWDRPWLQASLAEAYVAVGNWDEAARWYGSSAAHPEVGAFQIASSIRQLEEVWQLSADMPDGSGAVVRTLKVHSAVEAGGTFVIGDKAAQMLDQIAGPEGLEPQTVLGKDWPIKLAHIRDGLKRAQSVAAVYRRDDLVGADPARGTAFLVDGGALHPDWQGERVALTAAHVCSKRGAVRPHRAVFVFHECDGDPVKATCAEVLCETSDGVLDYCVMRLEGLTKDITAAPIYKFEDFPDDISDADDDFECRIIGHPDGREMAISLANSRIIDIGYREVDRADDVFLRYTAPTLGGNSGSPVFDKAWNVIGMHRAGIRDEHRRSGGIRPLGNRNISHVANEGVSLKSIAREIRSLRPSQSSVPIASDSAEPPFVATTTPQIWEAIAAAIADPSTPEALVQDWADDPHVLALAAKADEEEIARSAADGDALPEGRRDMRGMAMYLGAVALSKAFRERRNHGIPDRMKAANRSGLAFVSEGDSWFQYPWPRVRDVIDHLSVRYPIYCRAIAGMEFERIFADTRELRAAIADHRPDGVLLSGGGNDLLGDGLVVKYVRRYDPKLAPEAHLDPRLDAKIADLVSLYEDLIRDCLAISPGLKFFIHGYDWALPRPKGAWLRQPLLEQRGIQRMDFQRRIVATIVDRYNDALAKLADRHPGVLYYVDCRGTVGSDTTDWLDELHPTSVTFAHVAARFDREIRRAFADHPSIKRNPANLH